MNWTVVLICAGASLALAALFKYGFLYLQELLYIKFNRDIARQVVEKHSQYIADGVVATVAERLIMGAYESEVSERDNQKSVRVEEAGGADY